MEVSIKSDDNTLLISGKLQNGRILGCGISDVTDMDGIDADSPEQVHCCAWQTLIQAVVSCITGNSTTRSSRHAAA